VKRIEVVRLEKPGALPTPNADVLLAWDREADSLGAPQNVSTLLGMASLGLPLWYRGGIETVHIAELILGLGCEKVLIAEGFYKTERTPEHFVRRIGERCVPIATTEAQFEVALNAGATWICCEFVPSRSQEGVELIGDFDGAWGTTYED
jgi:imidazole glycerol phosphate synthase subunit HisF